MPFAADLWRALERQAGERVEKVVRPWVERAGFPLLRVTLPVTAAFPPPVLLGSHRQLTDGYLLALAMAHEGILATLDRGISVLARQCPNGLEIVGS